MSVFKKMSGWVWLWGQIPTSSVFKSEAMMEKHSLEAVQLPGAASLDMEDVEHPRVMYKPAKLPIGDCDARFVIQTLQQGPKNCN